MKSYGIRQQTGKQALIAKCRKKSDGEEKKVG